MVDFVSLKHEPDAMPAHTKRIGRELALLYMFSSDLLEEVPSTNRTDFYAAAAEWLGWKSNRLLRKGGEYADTLLDIIALHQEEIDARISAQSANWEWERLPLVDRNIMRMAVSEMLYVAEVPPVVSINEAVEIAMDYSGENSGNFINGLLNAIKDSLPRPAREAVDHL